MLQWSVLFLFTASLTFSSPTHCHISTSISDIILSHMSSCLLQSNQRNSLSIQMKWSSNLVSSMFTLVVSSTDRRHPVHPMYFMLSSILWELNLYRSANVERWQRRRKNTKKDKTKDKPKHNNTRNYNNTTHYSHYNLIHKYYSTLHFLYTTNIL